jgi:N-acetylmuramoyl-L-alanine amidase
VLFSSSAMANYGSGRWTFHFENQEISFENLDYVDGLPWLKAEDLAKRFGLKIEKRGPETFRLSSDTHKSFADLSLRHKEVKASWGQISLSRIPLRESSGHLVPLDFGDRVLRPLLTGTPPRRPFPKTLPFQADIVIDPGHGGNDHGASILTKERGKIFEKDLVLKIARDFKTDLESKGLRVLLTREDDVYLALPERVAFANRYQAKLFLSLHLNFDPASRMRGYEIYVLSLKEEDLNESRQAVLVDNMKIPSSVLKEAGQGISQLRADMHFKESLEWAKILDQSLSGKLPASEKKAVRMGPFYVLYGAHMPALLLELGYLNSAKDRVLLEDPDERRKLLAPAIERLALALKKGIVQQ